ncbi:MAG: complex I NDUFA9 subunit family protein [Geminicoccaceae bacterium]
MQNATITVFGGSGFIGQQVVKRLAHKGAAIRIPTRNPNRAGHLRPLGDVGQIVPVAFDARDPAAVGAALENATHAVNLVGILHESRDGDLHESRDGDFDRVHGDLAGQIAAAAKKAGASAFVQLSAIGADSGSSSAYARSKAKGEEAVRNAFAGASILRPSVVFGPGDGFFHRFAEMAALSPFLPLVDGGKTRFQPVYVGDVADAIVACLETPREGVFELGGPEVKSFRELLRYMCDRLGRKNRLLSVPSGLLEFPARLMEFLPDPPITRDQLELLKYDNVVGDSARTLEDLGIRPTPMDIVVPNVIRAFARRRIELPAA